VAGLTRRAVRLPGQVHAGLVVACAPQAVVGVERHPRDLAPPAPRHIPAEAKTAAARGLGHRGDDHSVEGLTTAVTSKRSAECEPKPEGRVGAPSTRAEPGIGPLPHGHGRVLGDLRPSASASAAAAASAAAPASAAAAAHACAALGGAGDAGRPTWGARARATVTKIAVSSSYRHRHQAHGDGDQTQNDSPASHRGHRLTKDGVRPVGPERQTGRAERGPFHQDVAAGC
jgi:hypothetical protein